MTPLFRFLAPAGLLLLAPACTSGSQPLSAGFNPSIYSVHQPVVQRTDYVFDLNAGGGLQAGEAQRLRGWFETLGVGYGDRVALDRSTYIDVATRERIAGIASYYGLILEDLAPTSPGESAPGTVRIILSRTTASVPGCPDWSRAPRLDAPLGTDSNFGCATNSNLAAMIADPNDLVRGRSGNGMDDAYATATPVRNWRERTQTGGGGTTVKSEKEGQQ